MYEVTVDELATLLRCAENAHAAYEKERGSRDDDWPTWYAKYILDNLEEGGPGVE
jgi:hypothetical protein